MKNKLISTLFCATLLLSGSAQAMGRFGHYARKAFSGIMTTAHWGISAVPMFGISYFLLKGEEVPPFFDKHTKELSNPEATVAVQKFARDILNDPNLNVRKANLQFSLPIVANYNSIDIHDDIDSHINAILQQKNASDPLEFDQRDKCAYMKTVIDNSNIETYKGMLHREYAHIKNNDIQRIATCAAISPFLTHLASNALFEKKPTTVARTLLRIPTGFAKLGVSFALCILYSRHREQKADDAIPNDPSILKNQRNFWLAIHEAKIQAFHNSDLKEKCRGTLIDIINGYPSHTKRAQRFQQRLDKLEKKKK